LKNACFNKKLITIFIIIKRGTSIKLYYTPKACSLAAHIALCEANLDYSLEAVNLSNKTTASGKNFYDITPKGQVPALMLDDNKTVLTEGAAILQYIADLVPSTKLIAPIGEVERYEIIAWINFIATELHKNFMPLFKNHLQSKRK
jgi:glutathione S-transferase